MSEYTVGDGQVKGLPAADQTGGFLVEATPEVTPEVTPAVELVSSEGGAVVPDALREVDPAKLAEIREKLGRFMEKEGKTVSGSEDPDSAPKVDQEGRGLGEVMKGADVDWSEYDLNFSVQHLYQRAMFRNTPQGPKWVVMLNEFYSTEKDNRSHGAKNNIPGTTDGQSQEARNLGEYLTEMTNGPEGWQIGAIMPAGTGKSSVLLRRETAYILPDPQPLRRTEEVEAPKDQELQNIEDAALAFAADEGLTPPEVVGDDSGGEEQAVVEETVAPLLTPVDPSTVEIEEGTGAIVARDSSLVRRALDVVRPIQLSAPVPAGIQPASLIPSTGEQGEQFMGAQGVENIRVGLKNLLDGPDFGDVK